MTLAELYQRELTRQGFEADPAQRLAVAQLEQLRLRLIQAVPAGRVTARLGKLLRVTKPAAGRRGLYLWGGVGRGKTWLMDLFHDSLPPGLAHRTHFHHFMRDVHRELQQLQQQSEPLRLVAEKLARDTSVLCLDELFVSDIADAMILGALFEALLGAGVMLVITSNAAPAGLYRDGLQRARFLPAIALLESRLVVHELGGGVDYRLQQLQRAPIYLSSVNAAAAREQMSQLFARLAGDHGERGAELRIGGRPLAAWRRSSDVVWFGFDTLCEGMRSQNDYVEIAEEFHTVFLSDVPRFDAAQDDAARRFIALVDEFYDQGVKLVVSAAAAPAELYQGERLAFEFQRTSSRLIEMQSRRYLGRAHRRATSNATMRP
jgi:cell division protein ZapE